jgi:DNA-binding beta-propeller fold protein YncE
MFLSGQTAESAPRFLYVLNSNFDLRFNRGSVQAYDLDALDAKISGCDRRGLDCQIEAPEVFVDEVLVPSLGTSYSVTPDRKRLYIATRTDQSLLYIDLNETGDGEDVLQCDESERRCSDDRRRGINPSENARGVTFPIEPVSIVTLPAASAAPGLDPETVTGNFVMVAHRWGQVSLFHDNGTSGPKLIHVLDQLPLEPTGIDFDPVGHLAYLSLYSRTAANGASRLISRVAASVEVAGDGSLDASYLYDVGAVVIDGVAPQRSTRTLRMNPAREGQLLVTGERPASLLFVDVGENSATSLAAPTLPAREIVTVGDGAMRMAYGKVGSREVIAVSCFDAKQLYLIDAVSYTVIGVLHNLNGPFDVAIDEARKRLYLSDFRSSSVLVVDLSAVAEGGAGSRTDAPIVAMLGIPKVVMELQ